MAGGFRKPGRGRGGQSKPGDRGLLRKIGWYLWPRSLPDGYPPTLSMSEADLLAEIREGRRFLRGMGLFNAAFFDWQAMNRQYIRYLEQFGSEPIGIYLFNLVVAASIAGLAAFTGIYAVSFESGPATNTPWLERVFEADSLVLIGLFTVVGSVLALLASPRVMAAKQWSRVHCLAMVVSVDWELCPLCAGTALLDGVRSLPGDPECEECEGEGRLIDSASSDSDADDDSGDADTDTDTDDNAGADTDDAAYVECPKCRGVGSIIQPRVCHACDLGYVPDVEKGHTGVAVLAVNKLAVELNDSQHFTAGEGATIILAPRGVELRSIQDPAEIYNPMYRSIHGGFVGGNSKEMHEREKFQDQTGRLSPVQRMKARQRRWRNGVSWVLGLSFAIIGMLLILSQPAPEAGGTPPPATPAPTPVALLVSMGRICQFF